MLKLSEVITEAERLCREFPAKEYARPELTEGSQSAQCLSHWQGGGLSNH